ncbi:hypothetical protein [Listeria booriae]|uniref:DUF4062 domain-containing protein n=3 Tax=Listeria booriae TaxID=1552123 RepID=A0A7X1DL12_9LIST|nr:hypothetical protein [Listeria booriae]MBC2284088.1 hypothetical protein [Listeria booriae]MBC2305618.1 hypothetical protein [Listeria booriae]MBC2311666.1 hypothetical protein [Listeria booriae]
MVTAIEEKLKVFISSKIGADAVSTKYNLTRKAMKELLESTGLFNVYIFEGSGPSTYSAVDQYRRNLRNSDVCIFLIDNADDVPDGVSIEIRDADKYNIPSLYYFCNGTKKEETTTQLGLMRPNAPKNITISSFEEFIQRGVKDLIEEILSVYKSYSQGYIGSVGEEEVSDIEASPEKTYSSVTVLEKQQLVNSQCRHYFAEMIFGPRNNHEESTVEKNLDYYCSLFLPVLFENMDIDEFNSDLFLQELKKQFDDKYYQIAKLRWQSIDSYFKNDLQKSITLLEEALAKAEALEVEEWLIQDILIDLRNHINSYHEQRNEINTNNKGNLGLNKRREKLFYPLIDRYEKQLYEWIVKDTQKNDMKPYSTKIFLSDLSIHSNQIADIFYQSMVFGSITHLTKIYGLIQKLSYYMGSYYESWGSLVLVLKNTIMLLDRKRVNQVVKHFEPLLKNMDAGDAKEIFVYSNNQILPNNRLEANLLAIAEVGYYLDDQDFEEYWSGIEQELNAWAEEEHGIVNLATQIFDTLHKVRERIPSDYFIELGITLIDKGRKRYFENVLKMWTHSVDYDTISENNFERVIQKLLQFINGDIEIHNKVYIENLCCAVSQRRDRDLDDLVDVIKDHMPKFYENEYLVETRNESSINKECVNRNIDVIRRRNKEQGQGGAFFGYSDSPYQTIQAIFSRSTGDFDENKLDELFNVSCETIMNSNQWLEEKLEAYKLLMTLSRYDPELISRNADSKAKLVSKDYQLDGQKSMTSYADRSSLELAAMLLRNCFGESIWNDLLNLLPRYSDPGLQITACELIQAFLWGQEIEIPKDEKVLIFQFVLEWSNSSVIDLRWDAVKILIRLIHEKEFQKVITTQLIKLMSQDNAFVKSRLIHASKEIGEYSKETEEYIRSHALIDSNYVIRKIAKEKFPETVSQEFI